MSEKLGRLASTYRQRVAKPRRGKQMVASGARQRIIRGFPGDDRGTFRGLLGDVSALLSIDKSCNKNSLTSDTPHGGVFCPTNAPRPVLQHSTTCKPQTQSKDLQQ